MLFETSLAYAHANGRFIGVRDSLEKGTISLQEALALMHEIEREMKANTAPPAPVTTH